MERRKSVSVAAIALCIAIMLSANSIPVLANNIEDVMYAGGDFSVRLSGSGVIVDQSGRIVGWNARLTGTVQGEFDTWFYDYDYIICACYDGYDGFWYGIEYINLRFTWTYSAFGFGRTSQFFSVGPGGLFADDADWLNGQYADSTTWRINGQMYDPLYASLSLSVRWTGPFEPGRTGTITGKFKGAIPIPNTPGYMFVPVGGFSYGVNVYGNAIVTHMGYEYDG